MKRGMLGLGGLVTMPPEMWGDDQRRMLGAQGLQTEVVAVEARNVGRLPVSVQSVSAKLENGVAYSPTGGQGGNPPLPYRLEPGSAMTWFTDASYLRLGLAVSGVAASEVHFIVELGNGKRVATKPAQFS